MLFLIDKVKKQGLRWDYLSYFGKILFNVLLSFPYTSAQKMKFSIKNYFSKCDQIRKKLRIWLHLLKSSLMENFSFLCNMP